MASEPRVLVARVAGAFGVKGEVRILAFGEDPAALLRYRRFTDAEGRPLLTLTRGRARPGDLLAFAEEVATREEAEALKGRELYVPRSVLPEPEEDEYYLVDLVGLEARAPSGEPLGRVTAVRNFGAGDLLEVQPETGPSWYVAFTREAVPEVSVSTGRIVIDRPPEV